MERGIYSRSKPLYNLLEQLLLVFVGKLLLNRSLSESSLAGKKEAKTNSEDPIRNYYNMPSLLRVRSDLMRLRAYG